MAVTLEYFKNNSNPNEASGEILFYLSGSTPDEVISAMNIEFVDKNGTNLFTTLRSLETFTLTLLGEEATLNITGQEVINGGDKGDYYHFTFTPINVSDRISSVGPITTSSYSDSVTFLVPQPGNAGFEKSEYQAILNNTVADRTSLFILDVDRSDSSIVPLNYNNILSGSAQKAAYQTLNYTSIGLRNSRYDGAKTSKPTYGVSPAIAGTTFEAASYLSSSTDLEICSQSLSDRNLDTFVFTGTDEVPVSGSEVFKFNGNRVVPLRNRKLWVRENESVIYINQEGFAISSGSSCNL